MPQQPQQSGKSLTREYRKLLAQVSHLEQRGQPVPALSEEQRALLFQTAPKAPSAAQGPVITPRQSEVLHWLAEGKTSVEIGIILGISRRTVEKHIEHLYAKLAVATRIELVRWWLGSAEHS